jgi:hypothetical protein
VAPDGRDGLSYWKNDTVLGRANKQVFRRMVNNRVNDGTTMQSSTATIPPSPPKKKVKSYTTQFSDDADHS